MRRTFKNVLVLLSGGLDSAACLHFYSKNNFRICALYIDFGHVSRKKELTAARRIAHFYKTPLRVIKVLGIKKMTKGFVVGRNLFFVTAALLFKQKELGNIALGIHSQTVYVDSSEIFLEQANRLFDLYTDGKINVVAPFMKWNKADVWNYIQKNKIPHALTYSCELGLKQPCGKCLSCIDIERLNAIS